MSIDEVQKRISEIRELKHDAESAHAFEDDLYADFVRWVSQAGTTEQRHIAHLILETKLIDFPRWCA
jgi:hypothetical protein